MWFIGPLIVLIMLFVVFGRNNRNSENGENSDYTNPFQEKRQRMRDIREGRYKDNFNATESVGGTYSKYIEINTKEKKWRINVDKLKDVEVHVYDFSDLRDFEVISNRVTYAASSYSSLRGFGYYGRGRRAMDKIEDFKIRISFRDLSTPDQYIYIEGSPWGGNVMLDDCISLLRKIKAYNEEQEAKTQQSEAQNNTSVADELMKLKSLLDSGVITQEEFEAQKAKLL